MDNKEQLIETLLTPELYFLICKFLAAGPLQETAKVLGRELEEKKVLPKRTDWLGNEHDQTFAELERKYSHIDSNFLLQVCCRIGPLLDKELKPCVPGLVSLLGTGRQSLLRTKDSIFRHRSLLDYCTRLHGISLPDSDVTKPVHNIQKVLIGREYDGPVRRKLLVPTSFYGKTKLLRRTVGHLSSVYCVLFDRTGRYIITGADDLLIKIWSALDGRLLATLRGASAEITDIAINLDNTMLAAGSLDRILRVWDLQTTSPIAVLASHTGMITSVNFCPSPRADLKYLVTTSTDGSIAFWQYSTPRGQKITFAPKPLQYHEKLRPGQAQMMCTSFSPGGMFLAAGSADHHVRVYLMSEDGPKRILETEAYTDAVDSVQWSHRGLRFISGSKDGTAHIWTFESQQWKSVKLCMTERLPTCAEPEEGKKLKVTMVAWDCSDKYVITAVNDFTIKIWDSKTAILHRVLRGHKDELFVLESNPKDEYVLLSAGHDGQVFLWDIEKGESVNHFVNNIDGQGHGGVFDAKWSPDGTMIAATDSHGHIIIYGLGIGPDKYRILPTELFFHTDYRPLLRDASHHVVDEQTQIMPHLMPPPFLVDSEGNPHPAKYQKYVPGRENCSTDQLIPNLTVGADGVVVEDNANNTNYAHIDRLIAALANRQVNNSGGAGGGGSSQNMPSHSQLDRMIEALATRQGYDQTPDSNNRSVGAGNRSSSAASGSGGGNILGNGLNVSRNSSIDYRMPDITQSRQGTMWGRRPEQQQQQQQSQSMVISPLKYVRRVYVRPMKYLQLQYLKQTVYAAGQYEMQEYKREMRRRPIMISTASVVSNHCGVGRPRNWRGNNVNRVGRRPRVPFTRRPPGGNQSQQNQQGQQQQSQQSQPAYRTRAVRDQEEIAQSARQPSDDLDEDEESSGSSGDTSYSNIEENLDESSDDSDTESSDYSDWVADTPGPNLEPPKRSKRKPLSRRRTFSDDSSDATTEQATTSAKAGKRAKRIIIPPPSSNGEIPELYRPAEWLSEVIPRKTPYYPQMGDEVVYFRQGHHRYLEAIRLKKVYKVSHSSEPWNFHTLRDHELARVIGIKYEIRPPRLCCLKLAIIDEDGNMTGPTFKIKYHDMPDVLDFLVLKQTFDLAVQRNWSLGDRFRCMIGDGWWMGQIESRHTLSPEFPDSYFMCFRIRWDNGEYEYMSPWDMEPIDESRLPDEVGGAVPVLPEEIRATLYQPKSEEWHRGDRDGSCRRIINGLEQVMRLSIAEHFLAPVDLNIYPDYAYFIEYPIDLTTIKSRFENHFYRRITSAQFDVRYLATNAEKYNRRHTSIVKHARIITDLCLRIIREQNDIDVAAVYHQLVDVYHSSESENENESDVVPSTSTGPSTSAAAAAASTSSRSRQNISSSARRKSNRMRTENDWRTDCRHLLELMWQRPDSLPFREPVDTIEFPDYLEIVSTPMDLRTVKEDLLGGNYSDPLDFAKDVRLIFQNSKNYNTNKRSRDTMAIYSMTLRLSALFESHIKTVIRNWKAARRRANKSSVRGSSSSPNKRSANDRSKGMGRRGPQSRNVRRILSSAEESSHNDEDDDDDRPCSSKQKRGRNGAGGSRTGGSFLGNGGTVLAAAGSAPCSNRVTSSSTHRHLNTLSEDDRAGTSSRSSKRKTATPKDDDDDEEEELAATGTSSSDDDDDDDDVEDDDQISNDDSNNAANSLTDNSEESYNPQRHTKRKRGRKRSHNYLKSLHRYKQQSAKSKRRRIDDDSDEDYNVQTHGRRKQSKKRSGVGVVSSGRNGSNRKNGGGALSQVDESTQDTANHTPKKKGRPPKHRNNHDRSAGGNRPSTSANALLLQSPSRTTRNQANSASNSNGNGRRAAENDHSYHLPVRNGRIAESDSDSREVATARPTRASVKRAIMEWARGSDIEDDEEDGGDNGGEDDEAEEILPTPTPTKSNGATSMSVSLDASSASISQAVGANVVRKLRTNRNTVVPANIDSDEDDEDDSDDVPLAPSQASQSKQRSTSNNSGGKANVPHPTRLHRRELMRNSRGKSNAIKMHMTRSHATISVSTTAPAASSSTSSIPVAEHDHNYLGDPQPSTSSAALRNSRRTLSRHQRNADELDISLDPLENSMLITANARLHRGTPTSTTSGTSTIRTNTNNRSLVNSQMRNVPLRRGRSQFSQENSQTDPSEESRHDDDDDDDGNGDEDDENNDDDEPASDIGTDGDSTEHHRADLTDSEDNQPLTSYVPARKSKTSSGIERRAAKKKRRHSDASFVLDDDDDEDNVNERIVDNNHSNGKQNRKRNHRNRRNRNRSGDDESGKGPTRRNQRGTRNIKRPRYNELSDEDEFLSIRYKTNHTNRNYTNATTIMPTTSATSATTSTSTAPPTVNCNRTEHDGGVASASTMDSDDDHLVSVSSRGRVRKITAKARGIFKD